jgi:hypothetical protein
MRTVHSTVQKIELAEIIREVAARAQIQVPNEVEMPQVCFAVRDALGDKSVRESELHIVRTMRAPDHAFRRGRIESIMHGGKEFSGPLVRLALTFRALQVNDEHADELCDLYALTVRALGECVLA